MAVLDTTRPHFPQISMGQFLAKIAAKLSAWNDARATRTVLSKLSDRELDDIGLSRVDIQRIGIHH